MSDSRPSYLAHHFDHLEQQKQSATLGIWLFLITEVMFFGGLFLGYIVYRGLFPEAWHLGSSKLDIALGATNTVVLIFSSLTMALAVRSAQVGNRKGCANFLLATIILGSMFLGIKAIEYGHKFFPGPDSHYFLVPGANFSLASPYADQVQIFFSFYFTMTGMHAIHMIIGIGILIWLYVKALKGSYHEHYYNPVEVTGLYWHFVDIVWIFLFPLLYLIGRH
ncbi:MAG TPA: cytochrome c oxidase subunit 3 family protein [Kiritimatiellia bacterium]|nr:cytochrome c oxidase subunit 3 family protein [Kiritimatiellia bacterium]HMP35070.1 cytochrome c oxidase subunit 3 family protein [Kiritimatiellia bacterium]